MPLTATRRLLTLLAAIAIALLNIAPAQAADPVLDLENLTGLQAIKMMEDGDLTSVQLTRAYLTRIAALNKRGPGINAVAQLNQDALKDAALLDAERAAGHLRGPAHGLPIIFKDLIDVKGMYTSNGNYSLRNSFPATDSGIAKKARESGLVIMAKLGLSEYANSFGNQHSGFSNLTGQVLNGLDTDAGPSGSSSGTGAGMAASMSMLGIGTETAGSIISPSQAQGLFGLRPTVGLVPGYGIGPISASQDTAGPMERSMENLALNLQSTAGRDPLNEQGYEAIFGPNIFGSIAQAPDPLPNYLSALDPNFVNGKKIGYNGTFTPGTPGAIVFDSLVAAGAIMVPRPVTTVPSVPGLPAGYQQHKGIDEYYKRLGPDAPIKSLVEEVADNLANEHEALKFGNGTHASAALSDVSAGGANETAYRAAMPIRKAAQWKAMDDMIKYTNSDPAQPEDPVLAILGNVPSGSTAGTPQLTIPMGYSATQRRPLSVSIHGNKLSERNLIGVAYVVERATQSLRQPASMINPSMYRCAKTVPAPPFAARGGCNPTYETLMSLVGAAPSLPFSLETESAQSLQTRMSAGTLSAQTLTKAYLARIALTNAEGPAIQAVRDVNTNAIAEAATLDAERATSGARGPLHGIPVLLDDSIDVHGLATTAGSIALQHSMPSHDSAIVAKLKAAGAIILGKTNVSELNGVFSSTMPEAYSSLGGFVLLPSDTDNNAGGSSAGSAAATASGMAAMTVGMETGTDLGAQMISAAGNNGVVALKPTVGRVSREGVLPVAKSQDAPGPITRTVADAATQLQAIAGTDPDDPATVGAPAVPNYAAGLSTTALSGKRVAVISSTTAPYPSVLASLTALGATTVVKTVGTPSPNPPSIVLSEFKRDLDDYLDDVPGAGAKSLQEIVSYNASNAVEGLKYQQGELTGAQAIDLSDSATNAAYEADKAAGRSSNRELIDTILNNATPGDASDDFDVIVVPSGNGLVGIADRAGYPVLTVPAGFGTGGAGRNPIGVTFVGGAFSEATLLADAYAFEQATNVRQTGGPPSYTNPSMWRCVPYSTFFLPHHCNPGDLQTPSAAGPTEYPVAVSVGGTVAPTLELKLGALSTSLGTFVPGVAADYTASLTASVTSTGGDATLSVLDPSSTSPGHLVNGSFSLADPLQVRATRSGGPLSPFAPLGAGTLALLGYGAPVSNDPVTIGFKQSIGASEPLRTGTYGKTLLFTASTMTP
jgi:amidase